MLSVRDKDYRLPSGSHMRLHQVRDNLPRAGLAEHYGKRAVAELRAGRSVNAQEYFGVAWHHALELFGRRFGKRQGFDNIAKCRCGLL